MEAPGWHHFITDALENQRLIVMIRSQPLLGFTTVFQPPVEDVPPSGLDPLHCLGPSTEGLITFSFHNLLSPPAGRERRLWETRLSGWDPLAS